MVETRLRLPFQCEHSSTTDTWASPWSARLRPNGIRTPCNSQLARWGVVMFSAHNRLALGRFYSSMAAPCRIGSASRLPHQRVPTMACRGNRGPHRARTRHPSRGPGQTVQHTGWDASTRCHRIGRLARPSPTGVRRASRRSASCKVSGAREQSRATLGKQRDRTSPRAPSASVCFTMERSNPRP